MRKKICLVFISALCLVLVLGFPSPARATEDIDMTGMDGFYFIENAPSGPITLFASSTFTFSGNIPCSPSHVKSSVKTVLGGSVFKVALKSSTGGKAVKMRVINAKTGAVLAGWKPILTGKTTSLWGAKSTTNVYVQLQSSTSARISASGSWIH